METPKIYLLIFLIVIICTFIYLTSFALLEKYENINENSKHMEIVVARYNENLEWTNQGPFSKYPKVVYNKGSNDEYVVNNLKVNYKIQNVGRESHTYLYHIINNYDNLAEITIFLPGSVNTNAYNKWKRANMLMNSLESNNNTTFIGARHKCVRDDLYNFKMDNYNSTNSNNNKINPETKLMLSRIRPFGLWYDSLFEGINIEYISYSGIFAVSREDILQKPKSYYENIIKQLSITSNPEVGHYFERSWVAIFYPTPKAVFINTNHLF
jgi:hypothetical protein